MAISPAHASVPAPQNDVAAATAPDVRARVSPAEWQTRTDLAACHRLVAREGWDDLTYAHISARIPGEETFLINPFGLFFHGWNSVVMSFGPTRRAPGAFAAGRGSGMSVVRLRGGPQPPPPEDRIGAVRSR